MSFNEDEFLGGNFGDEEEELNAEDELNNL
jgi:hypothetical protein